jgi:hypothetical protein
MRLSTVATVSAQNGHGVTLDLSPLCAPKQTSANARWIYEFTPTERHYCHCRFNQYSSASMIVMTRSVTEGSDGSGEWYVMLLS